MNRVEMAFRAGALILGMMLSGCTDDTPQEKPKASTEATQAARIEITANADAKAIKVKEKKVDKSQSKSYYYDYGIKSEYDPNAAPANKDAAVRTKPRSAVDANIHVRSPYEKVEISMLVSKLSKTFRIKCSACHDDYANGIIGPSLLNRDSDYIYDKIAEFKSGKKSNPLMNDLIHMMSDEEIRSLADEIYAFNKEIKQMREKR